jgi:flagellar P-ring protein precursor FlgI
MRTVIMIALCLLPLVVPVALAEVRVKDITTIRGVRANQLVGYGLVTGLRGSGDTLRNAPFTALSMRSMLERMGVNMRDTDPRTRNVAAVIVTAELPPFASTGQRVDVSVSSLGDASSLAGGMLVLTPLYGPDQKIYAVAQGSVLVSGFDAAGENESVTQGVPTAGRIAGGAIIERRAPGRLADLTTVRFDLRNPDFATANAIARAINQSFGDKIQSEPARVEGPGTVAVKRLRSERIAEFIAVVGDLKVEVDTPARVIVDERTGTIVIGSQVRVSKVAVAHGNLTVVISETPSVSQPLPFSDGQTTVTTDTRVSVGSETSRFAVVEGVDLQTLIGGLNKLGLKPTSVIAILQAIKSAGALQAELVVQ